MTESTAETAARPERAFLDANVIRGQLTNNILLTLAERGVFEPRWSQHVIDEMRRNRPLGVSEEKIDKRIAAMNRFFADAMTSGHEGLEPQMQADAKDKHVLAGAVHSESDVLVTDNIKDFHPPSSGPHAMKVERLSQFLSRKLALDEQRVKGALYAMVRDNTRDPRNMSQLLDKMASQPELRGFAQRLNQKVPESDRGTAQVLTANVRGSSKAVALDGVVPPTGAAHAPAGAPEARKSTQQGQQKDKGAEQSQ